MSSRPCRLAIISAFSPAGLVLSKSMFFALISTVAALIDFSRSATTSIGLPRASVRFGSTPRASSFCTVLASSNSTALRMSSAGAAQPAVAAPSIRAATVPRTIFMSNMSIPVSYA